MRFYDTEYPAAVFREADWIRSSYSGPNGGTCVEVNLGDRAVTGVRDSKLGRRSPILAFPARSWQALLEVLKGRDRPSPRDGAGGDRGRSATTHGPDRSP
ncbi:DUF397 domain-containing protein [Amycolatopsis sp. NPDC052450]|uniref:DUF397 domain-containing protein n=1 Tax=Amycolatopsis sp. NPDC052450 TaxID=3363937 RepID=UPI0037C6613F